MSDLESMMGRASDDLLLAGYEMQSCGEVYEKYLKSGAPGDKVQASLCLGMQACPQEMKSWFNCIREGRQCRPYKSDAERCGNRVCMGLFDALTSNDYRPHRQPD